MNTYSMKIEGNYQQVGNAIGTFVNDNQEAADVLFEKLEHFKTLDLQLAPKAGDDQDAMVAIIKFETKPALPTENLEAFEALFGNASIKTLVIE